jgi:hypothetical protein
MKFGKDRWEAKHEAKSARADATRSSEPGPASPSTVGYEPPARDADDAEAIVDAEAVELPAAEPPPAYVPPAPPPATPVPPPPAPPFPVAEEPVAVVSSGPDPGGVTPLGEAGPFYASGHAHGTAPSWPEPVLALAAERPEVVVGAAFVGGILFAAIVRRLGS